MINFLEIYLFYLVTPVTSISLIINKKSDQERKKNYFQTDSIPRLQAPKSVI